MQHAPCQTFYMQHAAGFITKPTVAMVSFKRQTKTYLFDIYLYNIPDACNLKCLLASIHYKQINEINYYKADVKSD